MLALVIAGAPGRAAQTEAGTQPVDGSYRVRNFESERNSRDRLIVWLKADAQDGKLRVCGAYLAVMSERSFNQLQGWLQDHRSHLLLGAKSGHGYLVLPSFLTGRRLEGGQAPIRNTGERTASCVLTDAAWEDRFADDPFTLQLIETRWRR